MDVKGMPSHVSRRHQRGQGHSGAGGECLNSERRLAAFNETRAISSLHFVDQQVRENTTRPHPRTAPLSDTELEA